MVSILFQINAHRHYFEDRLDFLFVAKNTSFILHRQISIFSFLFRKQDDRGTKGQHVFMFGLIFHLWFFECTKILLSLKKKLFSQCHGRNRTLKIVCKVEYLIVDFIILYPSMGKTKRNEEPVSADFVWNNCTFGMFEGWEVGKENKFLYSFFCDSFLLDFLNQEN